MCMRDPRKILIRWGLEKFLKMVGLQSEIDRNPVAIMMNVDMSLDDVIKQKRDADKATKKKAAEAKVSARRILEQLWLCPGMPKPH